MLKNFHGSFFKKNKPEYCGDSIEEEDIKVDAV